MTVYVVLDIQEYEPVILGIYADRQTAEKRLAESTYTNTITGEVRSHYWIEEYDVIQAEVAHA
jgi:hypothetical protein